MSERKERGKERKKERKKKTECMKRERKKERLELSSPLQTRLIETTKSRFSMAFFCETKGEGLPSPSISSKRKRGNSSNSSGSSNRSASLKLAVLLVLVSAVSFVLGRRSTTTTMATTSSSSPAPLPGPSGSPEQFPLTVVTLSLKPRVFFLPGFADPALASALADATEPKLSPSTLALRPGEKAEDKAGIRTSDGVFVAAADDPSGFLAAVERKAEALTGIPRTHGEAFNVLRYRPGGRYETHYDSFDDGEYGPQASQRVATLIVYLKTPPSPRGGGGGGGGGGGKENSGGKGKGGNGSGGETCFPLAEADGEELERGVTDYRACSGLRVPPTRPGDALLFYNLHPNGTKDRRSMHGAFRFFFFFQRGGGEERGDQLFSLLFPFFSFFQTHPKTPK